MNQRGSVTPLAIGLALVVVSVAGVAVDGTRAFLFRRTLQNTVDAAALAGTSELDADAYYATGGRVVRLGSQAARGAALRWAESREVEAAFSVRASGTDVRVRAAGRVPTLFLRLVGIDHLRVAVSAYGAPVGTSVGSI